MILIDGNVAGSVFFVVAFFISTVLNVKRGEFR